MQRFICEQNIARFQNLLTKTADQAYRDRLQSLLASAKRDLAMLNSTLSGADVLPFETRRRQLADAQTIRKQFQAEFDTCRSRKSHPRVSRAEAESAHHPTR
jgi:hypothetical protein